MSKPLPIVVMALAIALCLNQVVSAQPRQDLKEIVDAARAGWKSYRARARSLQGRVSITTFDHVRNDMAYTMTFDFRQRDGNAVVTTVDITADRQSHSVAGTNGDYSFRLARKLPDRPWVLTKMSNKSAAGPLPMDSTFSVVDNLLDTPITVCVERERLPELFSDGDFKVLSAATVQFNGENLVRIDFRGRAKSVDQSKADDGQLLFPGHITLESGFITLDPARHWLIREYSAVSRVDPQLVGRVAGKYEYGKLSDGFPVLTRVVRTGERDSPDKVRTEQVQAFELNDDTPPKSAFYLPSFEIPDGPTVERPRSLTPWPISAAMLALAIAAVFRYLARRSAV